MEYKVTVTVPDEVYRPLREEALRQGRTLEEEVSLRLQRSVPYRNGDRRPGALEELFGSVSLGHPTDLDNESIDRDIARAIAETHDDQG
jgi:hypothetical protein